MKKLFVIAVVTIASASAFASKARLTAIQGAAHVSDNLDVVGGNGPIKPDQAFGNGEWVSFEWGANRGSGNTAVAGNNAEGGFVRKMGDNAAMGAYLGNKSDSYKTFMALAVANGAVVGTGTTATALLNQSNPLNLYYAAKAGDLQWGLGLFYVSNDVKTSKMKENIMGLTASATAASGWDAQLTVGLGAESKNETTVNSEKVLKGGSSIALSGGYKMDTMYVYGSYKTAGAKLTTGTTTNADWDINAMAVGVVNSHKKDGADFFYGVSYNMTTINDKNNTTTGKNETTTFPVIIGVEAEATSWMVLRGSVTQNVLLGSTKTAGSDANTISDSTNVAAGAGLKFGKFMLDGTFAKVASGAAAGTGLGADANFVTNVGMTYNF